MNWKTAVLTVFPKASAEYRAALEMRTLDTELLKAGILDNPLRTAAFFATVGIESGNMTALRENLNYRASQIEKVFGVGKHSAGITSAEAKALAGKPADLAERVYGLGNPKKAKELGNTAKGDGFKYRGIGPFQNTGKSEIERIIEHFGADSVDGLLSPALLFGPAILFWTERGLNRFADVDDTRAIRKRVNGGYNGYDEFKSMYDQLVKLIGGNDAQKLSMPDPDAKIVQQALVDLGYDIVVDGKYGPRTIAAVKSFQKTNGLRVDGIAGDATKAILFSRLKNEALSSAPPMPIMSDNAQKATGGAAVGIGAVGEVIMSTAREISGLDLDSPLLKLAPAILMVIGLGFIIWPMIRGKK